MHRRRVQLLYIMQAVRELQYPLPRPGALGPRPLALPLAGQYVLASIAGQACTGRNIAVLNTMIIMVLSGYGDLTVPPTVLLKIRALAHFKRK